MCTRLWTLDIGGHSELWVKDGDNHDTFAVVIIMKEYIIGHVLKATTYHQLLLKICICGTIRGCATIKISHENKVICTWIVTNWATVRICATNRVNTVFLLGKLLAILNALRVVSYSQLIWLSIEVSTCILLIMHFLCIQQ